MEHLPSPTSSSSSPFAPTANLATAPLNPSANSLFLLATASGDKSSAQSPSSLPSSSGTSSSAASASIRLVSSSSELPASESWEVESGGVGTVSRGDLGSSE